MAGCIFGSSSSDISLVKLVPMLLGPWIASISSPQKCQIGLHIESIQFALLYIGKLTIHLDMQLGECTNDYVEFTANNKLTWQHLLPLWSILQTFILVAIGIWQMQHLKCFLKPRS
ncbi:unnamed protein product [Nyctereutes procyonoides]|uniref:(raccoon dog) hypothetical protein n=1 Tax=Nyctereutes procyonoides TaxID=34880 RepID=A0A811YH10_NYCPR|nr:unnamed protein product [Nyctereutes procyonoides]